MSEEELIKETMMLDYSQLVMNNVYCHKEIERLNNIIKEVREYIEERYNGEVLTHTFDKWNVGELLNILKGVDKEWKHI